MRSETQQRWHLPRWPARGGASRRRAHNGAALGYCSRFRSSRCRGVQATQAIGQNLANNYYYPFVVYEYDT